MSANRERADHRAGETAEGAGELDRRAFLHAGAVGVLSLTAGGALAACGSDESGRASTGVASGAATPVALKTAPTAPFNPSLKPGLKPDLPRRMGCSLPAGSELFTNIDHWVREAAESRGIEYISAQANGDSPKQFQQTQDFLSRGVGALLIFDLAPPALVPLQLKAIKQGTAVICGPFANSTCQATTDQYKIGHASGVAAMKWIDEHLGGNAEVALFNQDQVPSQVPKYKGARDALKAGGPGIRLVADVGITTGDADEGFKLTNTILQRHPGVSVWVGGDGPLGGALSALEAAGKAGGETALFGVGDGDAQALDAIIKGGPYKSTQGFSYPVIAYAWGKYAADWLDGKSIPLLIKGEASELNSKAAIDEFRRAAVAPGSAFADNETTFKYFKPLGNTSYERPRYLTIVA